MTELLKTISQLGVQNFQIGTVSTTVAITAIKARMLLRTLFPQPQLEQRSKPHLCDTEIQALGKEITQHLFSRNAVSQIERLTAFASVIAHPAEQREFYYAIDCIIDRLLLMQKKPTVASIHFPSLRANMRALRTCVAIVRTKHPIEVVKNHIDNVIPDMIVEAWMHEHLSFTEDLLNQKYILYQGDEVVCELSEFGNKLRKRLLHLKLQKNMKVVRDCLDGKYTPFEYFHTDKHISRAKLVAY